MAVQMTKSQLIEHIAKQKRTRPKPGQFDCLKSGSLLALLVLLTGLLLPALPAALLAALAGLLGLLVVLAALLAALTATLIVLVHANFLRWVCIAQRLVGRDVPLEILRPLRLILMAQCGFVTTWLCGAVKRSNETRSPRIDCDYRAARG